MTESPQAQLRAWNRRALVEVSEERPGEDEDEESLPRPVQ